MIVETLSRYSPKMGGQTVIIYIALPFIYTLATIVDKPISKKLGRRNWTFVLLFPLFLMTAFRSVSVGSDTATYEKFYEFFSQQPLVMGYHFGMEFGYRFVNKLFGCLGIGFVGFQIVYSAFIYLSIGNFVSRYSGNLAFSVLFFVTFRLFFFALTGIRQMIAMAIILNSTRHIENRKWIRYLMNIIIASSFHRTASVLIALYFVPFQALDLKNIFKIIAISIPSLIGIEFILQLFVSIFPKYSTYLARIESYDGTFVFVQLIVVMIFMMLGIYLDNTACGIKRDRQSRPSKSAIDEIALSAVTYSFIFSLFGTYINIAGRISKYFIMYLMVFLPNYLSKARDYRIRKIVYYCLVLLLFVYYFVILYMRPEWDGVIPFRWMWN